MLSKGNITRTLLHLFIPEILLHLIEHMICHIHRAIYFWRENSKSNVLHKKSQFENRKKTFANFPLKITYFQKSTLYQKLIVSVYLLLLRKRSLQPRHDVEGVEVLPD